VSIHVIESPLGVRYSTLAMLVVIVVVVAVLRRRPVLGAVTAAAWVTAFEVAYELANILVHQRDAHVARTLALQGFWLLTVVGSIGWAHALGVRPRLAWVTLSAAIFAFWVALGFPYNWAGQTGPVRWWPEALNVGSKTALGVAYLLGALAPDRSGWREALVVRDLLLRVLPQRLHGGGELIR
jgi:hypothetical protein